MFEERLLREAESLLEACRTRGLKLATAESCTGGLIAALLTEILCKSLSTCFIRMVVADNTIIC